MRTRRSFLVLIFIFLLCRGAPPPRPVPRGVPPLGDACYDCPLSATTTPMLAPAPVADRSFARRVCRNDCPLSAATHRGHQASAIAIISRRPCPLSPSALRRCSGRPSACTDPVCAAGGCSPPPDRRAADRPRSP